MEQLNYLDEWPIILTPLDAQLLDYESVQKLETKNKHLTTGIVVLVAVLTGIVLAVNYNQKRESKYISFR